MAHRKNEPPPPPDVEGMPLMSEVKVCSGCHHELSRDAFHFDRDNHSADGFKNICKVCRASREQAEDNAEIAAKVDKLDTATSIILDTIAASGGSKVPHVVEVFEHLIGAYGGAQGLAQHYMANYLMAKPGSAIRQKLLDTMIRLTIKATETGAVRKPLDMMDDAELEILANEQAKRLFFAQGNLLSNKEEDQSDKKVS